MALKTPIQKFSNLHADQSGSIALMFALVLAVVVIAGGIAVDYARGLAFEAEMQTAADGAVLAAVRAKANDDTLNAAALKQIARDYFDRNVNTQLNIDSFKLINDGDGFRIEAAANVPTTLMGVTGVTDMDVNVNSMAELAPGKPLELVLVLDNTGSMSGNKLTALKDSANLLVDKVLVDNSETKIALVPFSEHVNVGMSNRNANWIDVPDDYSVTENDCDNTYPDRVDSNCRTETRTGTNDGVPYTYETQVCDTDYGDPVQVCTDETTDYEWKGCVGSRNYPLNTQDQDYVLNK
ncbi:MAG: pilus assembly protein TadG-related protein, partial [Anderseniella sp.]